MSVLFIIDPQIDFCDPDVGSLYVPGAEKDMARLVHFVAERGDELDDIVVSLDTHQRIDISHPLWWEDESGAHPDPFTIMTLADIQGGRWRSRKAADRERSNHYVAQLEAGGRYPHVIWPEHCLVGHPGHGVWPSLQLALGEWEARLHGQHATSTTASADRLARVHYVYKGTNAYTEHFSAIRAEVPDPSDPATQVNQGLLDRLLTGAGAEGAIYVAGQARSHCVANSVRDLVASAPDALERLVLLTDTTSDVPGFEHLGEAFVTELSAQGMRCETAM